MPLRRLSPVLAILALAAASAPAAAAFSCPAQDAAAGGDAIDLGAMPLGTGGALPQAARAAIGRLQAANAGNAHIVDATVAAYCRRVASESGLSDAAKAAAVERFAAEVARTVYSSPSSDEEDILVDVPVPHDTFNAMAAAAKTADMSQDAWINAAIAAKLSPK